MKVRLDQLLLDRGYCDSRDRAKRLIIAGEVKVGGHRVDKPATPVPEDAELALKLRPPYVSRAGGKLAGALDAFEIDPDGRICADIGASTGGFTDCLLQRGAARVHTFDVGRNQLVWKLRQDPRVICRERFNARHLAPGDVGEAVALVVTDVSFISLTLILPPCFEIMEPGADLVCLVKPQFELARDQVGKGGIVREQSLRDEAVEKIRSFCAVNLRKKWRGVIPSPITGTDGNQEYLAWMQNAPVESD